MPWREVSALSLRQEFVMLAVQEESNVRELCRRFGISPRTAYKWIHRFEVAGPPGLVEQPRRPRRSPDRTPVAMEKAVLQVRREHPAWGGRKIHARLLHLGHSQVPSPSTITAILHRHGLIDPWQASKHRPWQRFEHASPNDLWQMDFKGHFPLARGRCHPLTLLDDHSRFALGLEACADEKGSTVRERLTTIFRHYGLPRRMLMDNGSPWGDDRDHPYTPLTVWLLHLGVSVSHGQPYHPQTQGKDERFHRTLVAELLQGRTFPDMVYCQREFDRWRHVYNLERPHQALHMATPADRYQPSPRPFPQVLPPIDYGPHDLVRKVSYGGAIFFQGREFRVPKAFHGYPVALRPTVNEARWEVYFMTHPIGRIDLSLVED